MEKFSNFLSTTLAAAAANSDTTITVASSANVPSLGASDFFRATLISSTGAYEIVFVTNVTGTTWTVTRAQESTSALTLVIGNTVIHRLTAGAADAMSTRDTVSLGSPSGSSTTKTVVATASRAAYFKMNWRLLDSATPAAVPTLVPPTGSTVVEGEVVTASDGTYTFSFTHNGANRNWYLAVNINGEWTVSSAISLG